MDVEKTMRFILEMQAKHEVAIQQADECFASFREQTEERFRGLMDVTMPLARHGEETDRRINETDRLIQELRDSQAHTVHKLNALIDNADKVVQQNGSIQTLRL